jgi:hypothetical protein
VNPDPDPVPDPVPYPGFDTKNWEKRQLLQFDYRVPYRTISILYIRYLSEIVGHAPFVSAIVSRFSFVKSHIDFWEALFFLLQTLSRVYWANRTRHSPR